jgi:ubiquinone/menaquinone biosynthesis C-methylase UbiE/uncharacterized protein YbaR (Trm112 family)
MRRESLELLRCPRCGGALSLEAPDRELSSEGEIERGALRCAGCRQEYAVERGIPCFAPRASLTGLNRRMARFYDGFSWIYTGTMRLGFLPFGGERKARMAVLDHLRPAGARVLEVAVGPGPNVPFLLEMPGVREVYGLDVSLGQLLRGRARAARRGWPLTLFQGEAEVLPFADAAFDAVLQLGGINFFNDKRAAMAEMVRVARPGARIVTADESERVARGYDRFPGFSREVDGKKASAEPPLALVPEGMADVRCDGIWRAHGRDHGYCLSFTKPGGEGER